MPDNDDSVAARATVPLKGLLRKVETGWSPVCDAAPPAPDEWGVLRLSAVTSGKFVPAEAKRLPSPLTPRVAFEVKAGDVLMSRANGVKALVGIACSVGSVRPRLLLPDLVFRLDPHPDQLDSRFLGIALSSAGMRQQIDSVMRGTSGQYKISKADIQGLDFPDVPLDEQRRIVAAHAAFERRISAMERVLAKLEAVSDAVAVRAMATAPGLVPLGTWLQRIEAGKSPMAEDTPAGDGQWGVLKVSAVQPGWFKETENKVIRDSSLINPQYEVQPGDLLMTRANTEQLVGLACIARTPPSRLMLSDKTLRLVPDQSVADAEFIELTLLNPAVRVQIRAMATGTSGSMKNIGQEAVRQLLVPDVPRGDQRQVVVAVAASRKRAESVKKQIQKMRILQRAVAEDLLTGRR
ncbi:hypothetical protein ACFYXW_05460 [Streptomyces sp. NPDC001981]|uniref:restriction endonuclease subunit S n=1 Tax=Streptomyces sp. NPDC001981 TaxID=3364628 RepID=UPI00369543F0